MQRLFELEEWKDIEGYEGLYQVSNLGRIKSCDRRCERYSNRWHTYYTEFKTGKILKLHPNSKNSDYLSIGLHKHNCVKYYLVHRLVAQAFIPNPDNLPCVNHKDENPSNNRVENLEWCTSKYNSNYGHRAEKFSKSIKGKYVGVNNAKYGCKLSEYSKRKIANAIKGFKWMTNGLETIQVRPENVNNLLNKGFRFGRK